MNREMVITRTTKRTGTGRDVCVQLRHEWKACIM